MVTSVKSSCLIVAIDMVVTLVNYSGGGIMLEISIGRMSSSIVTRVRDTEFRVADVIIRRKDEGWRQVLCIMSYVLVLCIR